MTNLDNLCRHVAVQSEKDENKVEITTYKCENGQICQYKGDSTDCPITSSKLHLNPSLLVGDYDPSKDGKLSRTAAYDFRVSEPSRINPDF